MHQRTTNGVMPKVKFLTPDQARRVIDAAAKVGRQGERDKLLLTLLYRHGLRVSEAIDLRWGDFDLDAPRHRTLRVRRLKGSKDSVHTLEPDTVRMLVKVRVNSDGNYVFRSERGGPMSPDAVQIIVRRAGEAAGTRYQGSPSYVAPRLRFCLGRGGNRHPPNSGLLGT